MWRSSLALAIVAVTGIAATVPASGSQAAEPGASPAPPIDGAPAVPRPGELSVTVRSGVELDGRRWVMAGQRVSVEGRASSYAPASTVAVTVSRAGHRVTTAEAPLRREGAGGRFQAAFTARRTGRYLVEAERESSDPVSASVHAAAARARRGSRGASVRLLQHGLRSLGYVTPTGGSYDAATARAVLAYRKVTGMARRTSAPRRLLGRVMDGRGAFRVRYPRAGRHVEFDFSRQVLVLARGERAERVYHASSGQASTPTVFGTFRFYRKQPGTNSHGMVHSNYFIRGYAIHGYRSVPTRPASHGCIRVPIPDSRSISRWISLGDRIFVYR